MNQRPSNFIEAAKYLESFARRELPDQPALQAEAIAYVLSKCPSFNQIPELIQDSVRRCVEYIRTSLIDKYSKAQVKGILLGEVTYCKMRFCREIAEKAIELVYDDLLTAMANVHLNTVQYHATSSSVVPSTGNLPYHSLPTQQPPLQPVVPPTYHTSPAASRASTNSYMTQNPTYPGQNMTYSYQFPSAGPIQAVGFNQPYIPTARSHIPSTPVVKQLPPCHIFCEHNYCKSDCKGRHPRAETICRNLVQERSCTKAGCKFQHPNRATVQTLKKTIYTHLKISREEFEAIATKYSIRTATRSNTDCKYDPSCTTIECNYQHPKFIASIEDQRKMKPLTATYELIDVTDSAQDRTFLETQIFYRSSNRKWGITKLVKIINTTLRQNYDGHKKKLETQFGKLPPTAVVCHGTNAKAAQDISKAGFHSSARKRNAFGDGHYFAIEPEITLGYTSDNTMLVCEVFHDSVQWVDQVRYFVVPEDHAILPLYILTFSVV